MDDKIIVDVKSENYNNQSRVNKTGQLNICDIENCTFVIPHYQRGYRWTVNNVKQLLSDLNSFIDSRENAYCLQPIVLQKLQENRVLVVDGQQRLTTIAIIIHVLGIKKLWEIEYQCEGNKTLSELLEGPITSINDYFRNNVKEYIENEFPKDELEKIKNLIAKNDYEGKKVFFIDYYVNSDEEGYDAFLRLNGGKTPLTSSELIRAMYMVNASGIHEHKRMEISKEWELIENALSNEQFWLMLNAQGLEDTPTRIDLLFALVLSSYLDYKFKDEKNKKHRFSLEDAKTNPKIIFERLDSYDLDLEKLWDEVLRCYWWMQSCFSDIELFNYLGWIRLFTDNSAKTVYNLWLKDPRIDNFKENIKTIIKNKYKRTSFDSIDYSLEKPALRAFFVLLNVLDCNHSKDRFRFDLYEKESWDIEHIDSQTPNSLSNSFDRKCWLYYAYKEINLSKIDSHSSDICSVIYGECSKVKDNQYEIDNISLDHFAEKVDLLTSLLFKNSEDEELPDHNKIGNLTLLNTHINRSYKNAIFPAKRSIIKNYINQGSCYIPPCTSKVFMKFYSSSSTKNLCWVKEDYDAYTSTMKKWYEDFVNSEEITLSKENSNGLNFEKTNDVNIVSTLVPCKINISPKRFIGETNFIDLMNQYHIVIPKIQRLYVQGRLDKNGQKCLQSFASTLVKSVTTGEPYTLDLIYGIDNESGTEFRPLDGQQRLTTLLLLAWLTGETIDKQWSFKYESRRATEFFIDSLLQCDPHDLLDFQMEDNYDEQIKKQLKNSGKEYLSTCSDAIGHSDWFLPAWAEDPGIAGMLEMLDSLYGKLLEAPTGNVSFSKVTFIINYLDVNNESYDQIFLKMNSRGKELSEWDNVKAVLDNYANSPNWSDNMQSWYEKMWEKFKNNNEYPCIEDVDNKMISIVELALECVGYNNKDKKVTNTFYLSKWLEKEDEFKNVEKFYKLCANLFSSLNDADKNKELYPQWAQDYHLDFMSVSKENYYRPLMAYYSTLYSDNKRWIRFCLNMIENTIDSKDSFVRLYKRLEEISLKCDNNCDIIYNVLELKFDNPSAQLEEEIYKAKQILHGETREDGRSWEEIIIEAENTAFFRGAIRFLYKNQEGKDDWLLFNEKFKHCKAIFSKEGLKDSFIIDDEVFSHEHVNKVLLSFCTDWETQLKRKCLFGQTAENWKTILLYSTLCSPVHHLLSNPKAINGQIESEKDILEVLLSDDVWRRLINKDSEAAENYQLEWKFNSKSLWRSGYLDWTLRLTRQCRDEILEDLINRGRIKLIDSDNSVFLLIGGKKYFYCIAIGFEYQYYKFVWQRSNRVDMFDKDGNNLWAKGLHSHYKGDSSEHNFNDAGSLLKELDRCITEYQKVESI